jgi:nucleoside-diphosphate-sugar epimerase
MRHTLLTGASGLLGGQLMARLLDRGNQLAVLVRPSAKLSGRERIEAILAREEATLGRLLPRPVVLEGDLTAPSCGLADAEIIWLKRACGAVLHNAASLEFIGADRAGEPWQTNVTGTTNLLGLVERAGIEEFHHVSTAYVCGLTPGPIPEGPSTGEHGFRNDYEASKHEAERLVRSARFLREPTFYRPAVIVGDSRTGATTTYHGMMAMLQLMTVIVRSLPADENGFRKVSLRLAMTGEEKRNMIPVDWVADVIARLFADPAARGQTIHLAPEKPITIRQIIDFTSSYLNSGGVEFCGPTKPAELNDVESFAYGGKGLYEAYEQTDPIFETGNLKRLVPDLPCPVIDEAMMHRFLAYGDADRWGKRKPPAAPVAAWAADLLADLEGDDLVALAEACRGRASAADSAPGGVAAGVGLDVVGPGGGAWTIRRKGAAEACLDRGRADGVPVCRGDVATLIGWLDDATQRSPVSEPRRPREGDRRRHGAAQSTS